MNSRKFLVILSLGAAVPGSAQMATTQQVSAERQRAAVAAAMAGSVSRQMASAHQKTPAAGFFLTPASLPAPSAGVAEECERLSPTEVSSLADRAASANQVSPDLVRAVMHQESAFRPCAVSSKGASGLMQLMPETAAELGVSDVFDPEQNAFGGAHLLRQLLDRYSGNLNLVLGAYNAGSARVDQFGGIPPIAETKNYVDSILRQIETVPTAATPALAPGDIEPW